MKPPFYKTKKFLKLNRQWQKKLKKEKFPDIERGHLGGAHQDLCQRVEFRAGVFELTQAYFNWAISKTHGIRFKTRLHRQIWTAHAEGKSAAEIGREVGLSRWRISDIIPEIKKYLETDKR